jgi:hypothetical protein
VQYYYSETYMTRLILTTDDSRAGCLKGTGLADIVIWFGLRFVCGPLPSDAELATFLEARSTKHGSPGSHWLDFIRSRHLEEIEGKNLGLIDLCERCETIELWVDPEPNAPADADLAAGLFAPSREDRFEADVGSGGRPHRQSPAGWPG